MIHHAFFTWVSNDGCFAQSIGALTVAMVKATFRALLVSPASGPLLLYTRDLPAAFAAVSLSAVTVRADEKEAPAL